MIVDSSALLAIILAEPDTARFGAAISLAERAVIAAPNWVEAAMVVDRRADAFLRERFEELMGTMPLEILPFTAPHARAAKEAWSRYGRGRHRVQLNYGDCMAYAVAKVERQPLLFKGNDFAQTDIEPALKA